MVRGKSKSELLASGYKDTFRELYPNKVKYSWWSYRMKGRERNVGWRIDYRMHFEDDLRKHLNNLNKKKPVIYTGDLNVAHEEIDLKNPDSNHFNPGFSDEERAKFSELLASGYKDTFRELYPNKVKYSWWSYRMKGRERNVGWRIDYYVVSDRLMKKVKDSLIYDKVMGSDHCPVGLVVDL